MIFAPLSAFPVLLIAFHPLARSFNPSRLAHAGIDGRKSFKLQTTVKDVQRVAGSVMQEDLAAVYDPTYEEMTALLEFAVGLQENLETEKGWEGTGLNFSAIRTNCHVAPSSRHGLGLFASRDLEKDTIAQFYPVHALGNETHAFSVGGEYNNTAHYKNGLLQPNIKKGIWIDYQTDRPDLPGWLGHRANDATNLNESTEAAILNYLSTSCREANTIMVPFGDAAPLMALITTRPIRKDEEILITYGQVYWLGLKNIIWAGQVADEKMLRIYDENDYHWMTRVPSMIERYGGELDVCNMLLREKYSWPPSRPPDDTWQFLKGLDAGRGTTPGSQNWPLSSVPSAVESARNQAAAQATPETTQEVGETQEEMFRRFAAEDKAARGGKKKKKKVVKKKRR
mmetsp:Transcript_1926/g.2072  ORF Transcript_1926/g.2072 Transcript_1926/m.2072 type:complete len:398 (+) Transcript_1926:36-1229(+)